MRVMAGGGETSWGVGEVERGEEAKELWRTEGGVAGLESRIDEEIAEAACVGGGVE